MPRVNKDRVVIDWVSIVVPYPFYEVPVDEFVFESEHHNQVRAGIPTSDAYNLINDFFQVLAIDSKEKTDFTCFRQMKTGLNRYDTRYIRDGFSLTLNDLPHNVAENKKFMPVSRLKMGFKLDIQGRGCRYIEHALNRDGHTWRWFFNELMVKFPNIQFRRIDIAHDHFYRDDHLSPLGIYKRFEHTRKAKKDGLSKSEYQVTSSRKNFRYYGGGELTKGDITGATFYLGKSGDPLMLRIYDKQAERIYAHGETWRNAGKNKKYWTRYELQTRSEVSQKIALAIIDGKAGGEIWRSAINRMFAILPTKYEKKHHKTTKIKRKPSSKVYKVSVPKWWADFIDNDGLDNLNLATHVTRSDIEGTDSWVQGPVAHSIFQRLVSELLQGGDPVKLLEHWIQQGNHQINYSDIKKLEAQVNALRDLQRKKLLKSDAYAHNWTRELYKYFGDELEEKFAMEREIDERLDFANCGKPNWKPNDLQRYENWFYGK